MLGANLPGPQPSTLVPRTTRSHKVFSPWEVYQVTSLFDLERAVKQSLGSIQTANHPSEHTQDFDDDTQSPLSTPPDTPPPSPKPAPITFPNIKTHPTPNQPQPPKNDLDRRKQRRKATRTLSRNRKREEAAVAFVVDRARKSIMERYVKHTTGRPCTLNLKDVKVTPRAFIGLPDFDYDETIYSLDQLVGPSGLGYRLLAWNGIQPIALVDTSKRVIGYLAGTPADDDWDKMIQEATDAMEYSRQQCTISKKKGQRSRGNFQTLAAGVSYGGGQTKPTNVLNTPKNQAVLDRLSKLRCFKRISGFSTSVLATRAPKLYNHYATTVGSLYRHDTALKPPFPASVFTGATYNLGPQTVCCIHRDRANLTYGVCSITPAGKYNPKTGGHLVLSDLSLVIEFPPGSTILIPSAILSHSNTPIFPHETRYSFTQYTAGGIFRWVENGFMTDEVRKQRSTLEELALADNRDLHRWEDGIALLPTIDDLNNS